MGLPNGSSTGVYLLLSSEPVDWGLLDRVSVLKIQVDLIRPKNCKLGKKSHLLDVCPTSVLV
jgi:hypothetical protein